MPCGIASLSGLKSRCFVFRKRKPLTECTISTTALRALRFGCCLIGKRSGSPIRKRLRMIGLFLFVYWGILPDAMRFLSRTKTRGRKALTTNVRDVPALRIFACIILRDWQGGLCSDIPVFGIERQRATFPEQKPLYVVVWTYSRSILSLWEQDVGGSSPFTPTIIVQGDTKKVSPCQSVEKVQRKLGFLL